MQFVVGLKAQCFAYSGVVRTLSNSKNSFDLDPLQWTINQTPIKRQSVFANVFIIASFQNHSVYIGQSQKSRPNCLEFPECFRWQHLCIPSTEIHLDLCRICELESNTSLGACNRKTPDDNCTLRFSILKSSNFPFSNHTQRNAAKRHISNRHEFSCCGSRS